MEKRVVIFRSTIDPETKEETPEIHHEYRGIFLEWGIRSVYDDINKCVLTNTVAIVEPLDALENGHTSILIFLPEEIEFE